MKSESTFYHTTQLQDYLPCVFQLLRKEETLIAQCIQSSNVDTRRRKTLKALIAQNKWGCVWVTSIDVVKTLEEFQPGSWENGRVCILLKRAVAVLQEMPWVVLRLDGWGDC